MDILVDSNVILDIVTEDPEWYEWSSAQLGHLANSNVLWINPIIYAEVSIGFETIEELEDAVPMDAFRRAPIPLEAAFLAGKCFLKYRRRGGAKRSPLPDFYIGAHAAVADMSLMTRDTTRYRSHFPRLKLISPGKKSM